MGNHPNRGLPGLPLIYEYDHEVTVLGFARTEVGAMRIVRSFCEAEGYDPNRFRLEPVDRVEISDNRLYNTRAKADRANAAGRGWTLREI
jgi:hypothetical protein